MTSAATLLANKDISIEGAGSSEIRHERATRSSPYTVEPRLVQLLADLGRLGLSDPTSEIQSHLDAASRLRAEVSQRPASGSMGQSVAQASEAATIDGVDLTFGESTDKDRRERRVALAAAFDRIVAAGRCVHDLGDGWVHALAHVLDDAVKVATNPKSDRGQIADASDRWELARRILRDLRSARAVPRVAGAADELYYFTNTDAVLAWRVDNAERHVNSWEGTKVAVRAVGVPPVTLETAAAHRREWGYEVRTAAQVAEAARS